MSNRQRWSLIVFGVLLALSLLEVSLRLYVAMTPNRHQTFDPWIKKVPGDARLGYRNNPRNPDLDARRWRNASAVEHADIVALGDSLTYGYNVSREDAWPQRLGRMLNASVYQMAVGGYGPGQYLLLFDEAAALRPKVILTTYYLGNDLFDSFALAYHVGPMEGTLPAPALDSLVTTDSKTRELVLRAEAIDPGVLRGPYLWCEEHLRIPDPHLQQVHNILSAPPLMPIVRKSAPIGTKIDSFLTRWSVLYEVARRRLQPSRDRTFPAHAVEDYGPPICVHYQHPRLGTVFSAGYHLLALDETDPRIAEGERISLLALQALAERARRAQILFYVVLIDTKETAFRAQVEGSLHNEPYLSEIWRAEAKVKSRAFAFFRQNRIDVIDTLPPVEALIASGINPYTAGPDDHPLAPGYNAFARAVADRLHHDGLGRSWMIGPGHSK